MTIDQTFEQPTYHPVVDDLVRLVAAWGKFLDTPASAKSVCELGHAPGFHLHEYQKGRSGWLSFNQFLRSKWGLACGP